MRVISGKYKGKKLEGFTVEGTRPTMDRVKESLFAMIQGKIKDAIVLDLFAGSGALGIEALSNGAKEAYFVDSGKTIQKVLKKNLEEIENAHSFEMDAKSAISLFQEKQILFDIIFLDPPYSFNLITPTLQLIKRILKKGSIVVCEYEKERIEGDTDYTLWKEKQYGEKKIAIYIYLP